MKPKYRFNNHEFSYSTICNRCGNTISTGMTQDVYCSMCLQFEDSRVEEEAFKTYPVNIPSCGRWVDKKDMNEEIRNVFISAIKSRVAAEYWQKVADVSLDRISLQIQATDYALEGMEGILDEALKTAVIAERRRSFLAGAELTKKYKVDNTSWDLLWDEIVRWYGDIQKRETKEEFLIRLKQTFVLGNNIRQSEQINSMDEMLHNIENHFDIDRHDFLNSNRL